MKRQITAIGLFILCSVAYAGPNPGVPTESRSSSRLNRVLVHAVTPGASSFNFDAVSFRIVDAWIEKASSPKLPFGRNALTGYYLVCRLAQDGNPWPQGKFTLWSEGAMFGGAVGVTFSGKDVILIHPQFAELREEFIISVRRESDGVITQKIKFKK